MLSVKLTTVTITSYQCYKFQNFQLCWTKLKYDVSCSLKFQVQVVRQQLQLRSEEVQKKLKLHYVIRYISLQIPYSAIKK